MVTQLIIHADGASRHNPGPAAIGATLRDSQGKLVASVSRAIGRATNNQAEYRAVIAALEEALKLGASQVMVKLDSELVVRQLSGQYRVRQAGLQPLHRQVTRLLAQFRQVTISHVPRQQNAEADRLANQALDTAGH
ncbi:MAG: ribonuclease HI family protein [Chloroflexota bacterium]